MAVDLEQERVHKAVLRELRDATGADYPSIDAINTQDKATAAQVLPVLAEWPVKISDRSIRHAIYARFHTLHARPFFERILHWWLTEDYQIAVSGLTQTISLLVSTRNAELVWNRYRHEPPKPFHYMLLAKLAALPSRVSVEVIERLIEDLQAHKLSQQDLGYVGRVNDARITELLRTQVPPTKVRVKRAAGDSPSKKSIDSTVSDVLLVTAAPDRAHEIFSTEADLEYVSAAFEAFQSQVGFALPKVLRDCDITAALQSDVWAVRPFVAHGRMLALWVRREDVDTLHIVITTDEALGPFSSQ